MNVQDIIADLEKGYVEDITIVKSPTGKITINANVIMDNGFLFCSYPVTEDISVDEINKQLVEANIK